MSVWKELRCDDGVSPDCYNNSNRGPKGFEAATQLRAQANRQGWTRPTVNPTQYGDRCPPCSKMKGKRDGDS